MLEFFLGKVEYPCRDEWENCPACRACSNRRATFSEARRDGDAVIDSNYFQCSFFSPRQEQRMRGRKPQEARLYRIGEAARMLNLQTSVLRFWEGEFEELRPLRTPKGQRLYTEKDMAVLRKIRGLLHEKGMTIEGARRMLAGSEESLPAQFGLVSGAAGAGTPSGLSSGLARDLLYELIQIRGLLAGGRDTENMQ